MRILLISLFASTALSFAAPVSADPGEPDGEQVMSPVAAEREARSEARQDARDRSVFGGSGDRQSGWERMREERSFERTERTERPEPLAEPIRPAVTEAPVAVDRPRPTIRDVARDMERVTAVEPVEAPSDVRVVEPTRGVERERRDIGGLPAGVGPVPEGRDSVREWRRAERERRRAERLGEDAAVPPVPAVPPVAGRDLRDRRDFDAIRDRVATEGWRRDWRRDGRHDWRRHRDRNRHLYRWGFYHDPFGWRYRPWHIGWRLWPHYYTSRHWVRDPWQYRLPPVYGPYRWIRYYDDVLLVDLRTGRVVDVIRNFFW